jgi:hypothetical protein
MATGLNPRKPIVAIFGRRYPRAAIGHAAAAPRISLMKSRRLTPNMGFLSESRWDVVSPLLCRPKG